jgi:hypothetical protein
MDLNHDKVIQSHECRPGLLPERFGASFLTVRYCLRVIENRDQSLQQFDRASASASDVGERSEVVRDKIIDGRELKVGCSIQRVS